MSNPIYTHEDEQGLTHYRIYNQAIVQRWDGGTWVDMNTVAQGAAPALSELFVSGAGDIYVSRYGERWQLVAGEWVQVTR